jgi:hypothetical protein
VRRISLAPVRPAHALRATASAVLLAGYWMLWRGDVSVSPVLLVIAYVALIPAAILTWR